MLIKCFGWLTKSYMQTHCLRSVAVYSMRFLYLMIANVNVNFVSFFFVLLRLNSHILHGNRFLPNSIRHSFASYDISSPRFSVQNGMKKKRKAKRTTYSLVAVCIVCQRYRTLQNPPLPSFTLSYTSVCVSCFFILSILCYSQSFVISDRVRAFALVHSEYDQTYICRARVYCTCNQWSAAGTQQRIRSTHIEVTLSTVCIWKPERIRTPKPDLKQNTQQQ